jgi:phospholipid/cholesterol/gamma-HCH transport system permease protein
MIGEPAPRASPLEFTLDLQSSRAAMPEGAQPTGGGELSFQRAGDATLVIRLAGPWRLQGGVPSPETVEQELTAAAPRRIAFDASALTAWDSAALTFLTRVAELCRARHIPADRGGLPLGIQRLLALAEAVPEKKGARAEEMDESLLEVVGKATLSTRDAALEVLRFLGEATAAAGRFLTGRARYRRSDLFVLVQQAGAEALPIVTLISFLVGLILAFVGAVQLQQFGASIYVADLVGIAMVREMGAMMTAIVMAGRTGASYAAQLGSMKVTQEIDALTTMGISPLEFLVLPRMVALFIMMPLLCLYADAVGILGGAAVGIGMLDLSATVYFQQTAEALRMKDLVGGVFKAAVYGILIALSGCLRGTQSGSSSSAVGEATTAAVVTSIVAIISACGMFAVVFYILGI